MQKLSFIDQIFLWRHKVLEVSRIGKHLKVFEVESVNPRFILKFSYAGNTQYHKLNEEEAVALANRLNRNKKDI